MDIYEVKEKADIDPINKIEKEVGNCKVRLFFSSKQNDKIERIVLDNLMLVFDKRMKADTSNV